MKNAAFKKLLKSVDEAIEIHTGNGNLQEVFTLNQWK